MIPFLVLFLRRPDRLSWVVLLVLALGSCALTGRIIDLPARLATLAQRAGELSAPGKVNDYSYEGTRNESIISFEHLFYRLGMRDREWIRYAQVLALLAVGAWVAYLVIVNDLPRPAAACLVSFFSLLFLYHRDYDTCNSGLALGPLRRPAGGGHGPGSLGIRRDRSVDDRGPVHELHICQVPHQLDAPVGSLGPPGAGSGLALRNLVDPAVHAHLVPRGGESSCPVCILIGGIPRDPVLGLGSMRRSMAMLLLSVSRRGVDGIGKQTGIGMMNLDLQPETPVGGDAGQGTGTVIPESARQHGGSSSGRRWPRSWRAAWVRIISRY